MSRTPAQVTQDILDKLKITDPSISFEIGTPERKIIDAVGETIAASYIDNYIAQQSWDIDALSGIELEQFVGLFGFGRLTGQRATGTVTFQLSQPSQQPTQIPLGVDVFAPSANTVPELHFATLFPATLEVGQTTVEVEAQAVNVGSMYNLPVGQINSFGTQLAFTSVTNNTPFTGGVDPESDDSLRQRFKNTFLRNIAGTADFYSALALQYESVSRALVLGPVSRYTEQLQITNGKATSQINESKFTWPQGEFVAANLNQTDEVYYTNGVDYTFSNSIPPVLSVLNSSQIPDGTVLDVQHEFCCTASRNDPVNGISNKVDIYIDGSQPVNVFEETVISNNTFSNTASSPYYVGNFVRVDGGVGRPLAGRFFQRLGSTPIINFPSSIVVGVTTYTLGVDYCIVKDTTLNAGTEREISGIEWLKTAPVAGTSTTFEYSFNQIPQVLNSLLKGSKQITTDPLVHEAQYVYFEICLTILYYPGVSTVQIDSSIRTALSQWFATLEFGDWIQKSDIEHVVRGVSGVDAARITTSADNPSQNGFIVVDQQGNFVSTQYADYHLGRHQLAVFSDLNIIRRSYNTY